MIRHFALVILSLMAFLLGSPVSPSAEVPGVTRYVLPGGLRLLVRDDPTAQVVAVSVQVRSGSRYETAATAGLSHFVQRAMIRGTARRSARQIAEAAEDLGGSVDASGEVEYAEIRGTALAGRGDALLQLLVEIILSPTFPAEEIERERRQILSQIQTRSETPFSLAIDTLTGQLYGGHPFGLPTLGHKASVERFSRDDLVGHYRRVYRAQTLVLAVSGRAERESVRRQVERLFAQLPGGQVDEPLLPAPAAASERQVLDRAVQQAQILMGFAGPGIVDPDHAPAKIMSAILGGGMAGRLFVKLRGDHGLGYSLGTLYPLRRDTGSVIAYVGTSGDTAEQAEATMRHELERLRTDGPSEAELARAKAYALGTFAMDRRTNARHAWYLAFFELAGVGWDYPEHHARALQAVTISDVIRVARRYLDRPVTVVVRPQR